MNIFTTLFHSLAVSSMQHKKISVLKEFKGIGMDNVERLKLNFTELEIDPCDFCCGVFIVADL